MTRSVKEYWNSLQEIPEELVGCYPMGHCGALEAPYRHLFEFRNLRKQIQFLPSMNVLEMGCGNGRWAISLAPFVRSYTGVDFSGHAIDIAKRRVKKSTLDNVFLHEQSILDFYGDRKYDIIYFSGVTQYLEDNQILQILDNLKANMSATVIIIDRSTINYVSREIRSDKVDGQDYYSIYRAPEEISELFSARGFVKSYQNRSYRFMRGSKLFSREPINKSLNIVAKILNPYFYYCLYFFSWVADSIYPIPFEGGMRSHDFFIFRKDLKK